MKMIGKVTKMIWLQLYFIPMNSGQLLREDWDWDCSARENFLAGRNANVYLWSYCQQRPRCQLPSFAQNTICKANPKYQIE